MSKLYDRLAAYGNENISPLHMPGHKRNSKRFCFENPFSIDITEIDGFDNLHHPTGILRKSMEEAAEIYGTEKSYFLVNGSSGGILAAISACVPSGGKILVARNCHKSVYHGIVLRDLFPVYLCPEVIPGWEINRAINPNTVETALSEHPDVKAVLVTSPTYEGICSDLRQICDAAHRRRIPVIVDAAHGAHFSFWEICGSAVSCGADLVIESLHKTLPSLTQTAILHKNSGLVDENCLEWYLQVYQTSSPSYVLMSSIDSCISYMTGEQGKQDMETYMSNLLAFREKMEEFSHVELLSGEKAGGVSYDVSRLVIRADRWNGKMFYEILRLEYQIQPEMCTEHYVILMTSVADEQVVFCRLYEVFADIDRRLEAACGNPLEIAFRKNLNEDIALSEPRTVYKPGTAMEREKISCPLEKCEGKVSGEFAYIYPPGTPLLVPGERITGQVLKVLKHYENNGFEILGAGNFAGGELLIVKEEAGFGQDFLYDGKKRVR